MINGFMTTAIWWLLFEGSYYLGGNSTLGYGYYLRAVFEGGYYLGGNSTLGDGYYLRWLLFEGGYYLGGNSTLGNGYYLGRLLLEGGYYLGGNSTLDDGYYLRAAIFRLRGVLLSGIRDWFCLKVLYLWITQISMLSGI